MGVRGITGIERMQHTLNIEDPVAKVHMAVFCMKLGKRVQVRADGYAEQTLQRWACLSQCFGFYHINLTFQKQALPRHRGEQQAIRAEQHDPLPGQEVRGHTVLASPPAARQQQLDRHRAWHSHRQGHLEKHEVDN